MRAWVAGCSTGEEAYSLAIAFLEARERVSAPQACSRQIFATDLLPDAIWTARQGVYQPSISAEVSSKRLRRFFVVRPAGRTHLEVQVLYSPGKGKS